MYFSRVFSNTLSKLFRFTGTIVGVEDISSQWEYSKWRSLKVIEFSWLSTDYEFFLLLKMKNLILLALLNLGSMG